MTRTDVDACSLLLKRQHGRTLVSLKPRALHVVVLPPLHRMVCFLVLSLSTVRCTMGIGGGGGGGGGCTGDLGSVAKCHTICVIA